MAATDIYDRMYHDGVHALYEKADEVRGRNRRVAEQLEFIAHTLRNTEDLQKAFELAEEGIGAFGSQYDGLFGDIIDFMEDAYL